MSTTTKSLEDIALFLYEAGHDRNMSTAALVVSLSEFLGVVVPMGFESKLREYRRNFVGLEKLAFDVQKLLIKNDFELRPFVSVDQLPEGKSVIYFMDGDGVVNPNTHVMVENGLFYISNRGEYIDDLNQYLCGFGSVWTAYWSDRQLKDDEVPFVGDVFVKFNTDIEFITSTHIISEVASDRIFVEFFATRADGKRTNGETNNSLRIYHNEHEFKSRPWILINRG